MTAGLVMRGSKALGKKFKKLQRKSPSIVKKAMVPAAKLVAKAIKSELPSTWKGAKRTIGARVNRVGSGNWKGVMFAKAGAGVGMGKKRRATQFAKAKLKGQIGRAHV